MACRPCREDEFDEILAIVNEAAEAYRGVIPADRWHDPYMGADELRREIADGVRFWGCELDGELVGVMGVQDRGEVELIRHAYVRSATQGRGIGSALLRRLREQSSRPLLVGTWRAAEWAIGFYEHHGFELVPREEAEDLLREHWSIPARQVETSVVLRS